MLLSFINLSFRRLEYKWIIILINSLLIFLIFNGVIWAIARLWSIWIIVWAQLQLGNIRRFILIIEWACQTRWQNTFIPPIKCIFGQRFVGGRVLCQWIFFNVTHGFTELSLDANTTLIRNVEISLVRVIRFVFFCMYYLLLLTLRNATRSTRINLHQFLLTNRIEVVLIRFNSFE